MDSSVATTGNIVEIIVSMVEECENIVNLKGADKKAYALNSIKSAIGEKAYNEHYFLIGGIIELLISISKGRKIKINKKIFCCLYNRV